MIGNTYLFDKQKSNLLLFFVFILISNNVYSDNMIIDDIENSNSSAEQKDYCENTVTKWCFVTDKVMGGVSEGSLKLIKEEEEKQKQLEYIKIKEWEEKFDREQKIKEQDEIRREQRLMQKEMEKKSKYDEINEESNKKTSALEKFNVDQTSEN